MSLVSPTRRQLLGGLAAAAGLGFVPARFAIGAQAKVKLGLMLPFSGTYGGLGLNLADAFKMRLAEAGGTLGGREVEFVQLDDESAPPKAKDNATRLIAKDKVDVLVGTVHSGVAEAMAQVAREEGTITLCPNAGAAKLTGELCSPNIFRTSFSNWQPAFPAGTVALKEGRKTAVVMSWNYPAGFEQLGGFKQSFTAGGGTIVKEILPDFPKVEFQAYLTEIASLKPDCVFVFFAGAGALKFLKDYADAGLQGKIPLYGTGFLTDGVYRQAGAAAEGVRTTLHYADALDTPLNLKFRADFKKATGREADVYAVHGYDTMSLLLAGMNAVKGDIGAKDALIKAMEGTRIISPRGEFTLSKSHNPVQDIYLRVVQGGEEKVLGVAHKALADPDKGCTAT